MKKSVWSLTWCIGHKEWKAARELLETDTDERQRVAVDEEYVAMLLSFALTYDAPFDIIKSILNSNPRAIHTPCGRAASKLATHANASLQTTVFLQVTRQQEEAAMLSQVYSARSCQTTYGRNRVMPLMQPQRLLQLHTTSNDMYALSVPHILEKSLEISRADTCADSDMTIF